LVRKEVGISPLSVSSDRIGVTAWRCARLLTLARDGRKAADRTAATGSSRSIRARRSPRWGLDRAATSEWEQRAQAGSAHQAEELLNELEKSADWLRWEGDARDRCVESDDFLDAFLCALIARAAAVGLTEWPRRRRRNGRPPVWRAGSTFRWPTACPRS
jgi:hypothetical protein